MRFVKAIPEGGEYPRGYGVAWRTFHPPYTVFCLPFPLSWAVFHVRRWYLNRAGPMGGPLQVGELLSELRKVGGQKNLAEARLAAHRRDCIHHHCMGCSPNRVTHR